MHSRFLAALTALFVFGLLAAPRAAHATTSFFVLDYNDGTTVPDYSFELNYTGFSSLTAANAIDLLAANVTNPSLTDSYQTFDFGQGPQRFYNTFGYAGKTATTSGDFSSFWNFWTSTNGVNWTSASVGASSDFLTNGSWFAFTYGVNGGAAPVTPGSFSAIVNVAAPEPGTLPLVLLAGSAAFAAARRRRASCS